MLWQIRKVNVGGQPSTSSGQTAIQVTLEDVEGVGLETHTFQVDTVNLGDPLTIQNAVCDLFNDDHTPNTFGCS